MTELAKGKVIMCDHWSYKEIEIEEPILNYGATVGAMADIDREPTISVLVERNGERCWLNFEGQSVMLVLTNRFREDGTPECYFAS